MSTDTRAGFEIIEEVINGRLTRFSIQRISDQVLIAGTAFHELVPLNGRTEEVAARDAIRLHYSTALK